MSGLVEGRTPPREVFVDDVAAVELVGGNCVRVIYSVKVGAPGSDEAMEAAVLIMPRSMVAVGKISRLLADAIARQEGADATLLRH